MADIVSPLPGLVATIHVSAGDTINEGDPVVTLQSMKMEIPVLAERSGVVKEVRVSPGDVVQEGDVLVVLT